MRYHEINEAPTEDQQITSIVEKLHDLENKLRAKDFSKADKRLWTKLNKQLAKYNDKETEPTTNSVSYKDLAKKYKFKLNSTTTQLLDTATAIKKDCQPYINKMNGKVWSLLRGMDSDEIVVKNNVYLKNRKPRDTPQEIHNLLNDYFVKTFGAEFRNALFCTGNLNQTAEYGNPYVVFPIGEFKFVWSANIEDLWPEVEDYLILNPHLEEDLDNIIRDVIIPARYNNTNLPKAVEYGHEIMIRCASYYAVKRKYVKKSVGKAMTEIINL